MDFVRGKYCIYDHLNENLDENNIYTVDTFGMSQALNGDGIDCKAVCLSDDTALQAIFFYSSFEIN